MKKTTLTFGLMLILSFRLFAQLYSISVNLNGKPIQSMIRAYQSNTTYIAIEDLLSVIEIPFNFDSEILRGRALLSDGDLFITAYNPFLFFVQNNGNRISFQMYQNVDFRYGKLFVPVKGISNFLNKYTSMRIDFNEKAFLININYIKSDRKLTVQKSTEDVPSVVSQTPKINTITQPFTQTVDQKSTITG